jgi:hypothetical protein
MRRSSARLIPATPPEPVSEPILLELPRVSMHGGFPVRLKRAQERLARRRERWRFLGELVKQDPAVVIIIAAAVAALLWVTR